MMVEQTDFSTYCIKDELVRIPFRCISSENVISKLKQRETHIIKCGTLWNSTRSFSKCILPNFTVVNVDKPPVYLRKFSLDGNYFIVFSSDQTSVEVYEFRGCQAAEKLLSSINGDLLYEHATPSPKFYQHVRENLFSKFFTLKHQIPVATEGKNLNRECSLFINDGHHVLVMSAAAISAENFPPFYDIFSNNEALSPNQRSPLEDYSLHCVDFVSGTLQSTVDFKCDKIYPAHNQGLYLFKNVLAVLSVQHQTIHIFYIKEGILIKTHSIGRFCFEDDILIYHHLNSQIPDMFRHEPYHDIPINSLKHRLLSFLYKKALQDGKENLRRFYQQFTFLEDLRLWKMQLLDEEHLLLKYSSQDVVGLRVQDSNAQSSFFVVFNFKEAKVLGVFENTSTYLLKIYEENPGLFRVADVIRGQLQAACLDIHSKQLLQRYKETIINAKYGGHAEAVKRLLAYLPLSSQSFSASPYLDLSLFSYDDKWISTVERPKSSGDYPIKFYSRKTGILKFQILTGMLSNLGNPTTSRKLVAFTFHPSEPFAISVQRMSTDYVINFHFRHVPAL